MCCAVVVCLASDQTCFYFPFNSTKEKKTSKETCQFSYYYRGSTLFLILLLDDGVLVALFIRDETQTSAAAYLRHQLLLSVSAF